MLIPQELQLSRLIATKSNKRQKPYYFTSLHYSGLLTINFISNQNFLSSFIIQRFEKF